MRNTLGGYQANKIRTARNYQNPSKSVTPITGNGNSAYNKGYTPHPLDVLKQPRVLGATVYDPVSKSWKVDDLRPRGWYNGKIACWGKCKIKKPWWMLGTGNSISCQCNKKNNGGCHCDGCLGGAAC